MTDRWERIESDVLVIGGGFGGLWAALRAAECGASVVLVDKSFAGRSGHSFFAGGAMMVMTPEDDPDEYLRDIVLGNEWLVDQDMVAAVFAGSYQRMQDLESFGISFRKDGGRYDWTKARGTAHVKNFWPANATGADLVVALRKAAVCRGVRIVDHTYIFTLIRSANGAVVGGAGTTMKSGRQAFFRAKSTILATNSGGFRGHHLASDMQGTGPFLGYEADAVIRNPEFHFINIRPVNHEIEGSGILPAVGARWKNARDEYFMEKYDPLYKDRAPVAKIVVAAVQEYLAGRAPITIDVEAMTVEERERFRLLQVSHGWMPLLFEKCLRDEGYDPLTSNIEWQPAYEANKLGLSADLQGRTTVEGLFAAGMARNLGISPFTGWSIAACTWSGYAAGEAAADRARTENFQTPEPEALNQAKSEFLAPLGQASGYDPDDLVHELQKILFPAEVLIVMSEEKLKQALERLKDLRREKLDRLGASDLRTVVKCRETETMFLAAEMTLTASLMRRESRPNIFFRQDYPQPDNDRWLRWIVVKKGPDGQPCYATEPIPFERYRIRPE